MRACCDLAERNARLIMQGKVSEECAAALAEDLRRYCPMAATYAHWLLDNRNALPPVGDRSRRRELRKRRKALQSLAARVHPPEKAVGA